MTTKHRQRRNPFSKLKQKKKKQFFSILLKTWIDFGDRFIYIHPKLIALKNIQLYSHFHQTLLPHNGLVQRDFPRCLIISMDTLFFFSFHSSPSMLPTNMHLSLLIFSVECIVSESKPYAIVFRIRLLIYWNVTFGPCVCVSL